MADKAGLLVQKLASRTTEGKVEWERTAEDGTYQVSFPNYSIHIFTREGESNQPDVIVQILDDSGDIVEEVSDVDLKGKLGIDASKAFILMNEMYKTARRRARGVDQALQSIMKALDEDPDDVPF